MPKGGRKPPKDGKVWLTKDGTRMSPKDMTDGHLHNSIMRIKRSPILWRLEYLNLLETELQRRKDHG